MATTREIVEQHLGSLGRVLSVTSGSTCTACLGPVSNHDLCYACNELWRRKGAPWSLADKILPMSSALNPGLWYTWLQTYKGYHQERGDLLAALVYEYTQAHRASIDALLGGSPTLWTIVPSKRGHTFVSQPFCRALCRVTTIANTLTQTLSLRTGERVDRREFRPQAFDCVIDVGDQRVLILEDTWVTGATAVSAAGALMSAGAAAVAIMPVARMIEKSFWPDDHPYLVNMSRPHDPWDLTLWPR